MDKKPTVNWEAIINDYKVSGKTQRQFCKDNNLALSTFCKRLNGENWASKKLKGKKSACEKPTTEKTASKKLNNEKSIWIAAEVPNSKSKIDMGAKPQLEISVGKFRISVAEFNNDTLLNVIQVLGKLC